MTANSIDEDAELFIKYNYTETKDFCKQFLTLVVAVLVFSLTFSEKVVAFQQASMFARLSLALAWTSMLIAIISCGIGVTFMALAGGQAVYGGRNYQKLAFRAYKLIVVAGGSFVVALVLLIVAASASIGGPTGPMPKPPLGTSQEQSGGAVAPSSSTSGASPTASGSKGPAGTGR